MRVINLDQTLKWQSCGTGMLPLQHTELPLRMFKASNIFSIVLLPCTAPHHKYPDAKASTEACLKPEQLKWCSLQHLVCSTFLVV